MAQDQDNDDLSDLLASLDNNPELEAKSLLKRSMPFEIADLHVIDHGELNKPLSLGMGFSVETVSGDKLQLDDLFQYHTHEGLLCGLPMFDMDRIERAIAYAAEVFPNHSAPAYVIPPTLHRGRRVFGRGGVQEVRQWCMLPSCTSFGLFTASRSAHGAKGDFSSILLIWFQDKFGPPDDPRTLRHISELDWDPFAHNWMY
jgi:hypothetical protein